MKLLKKTLSSVLVTLQQKEVVTAFGIAKERGIPTVSITGPWEHTIRFFKYLLLKNTRHENMICSAIQTIHYFLVDLLYLGLLQKEDSLQMIF